MRKLFLAIYVIAITIILIMFLIPKPFGSPVGGDNITSSGYSVPSTYYAMDNTHEVAVNPNGKQLYVASLHVPIVVVVDIDSANYPVLGEIRLPGKEFLSIPDIIFSSDGSYAYIAASYNSQYIESWSMQSDSYIIVINTTSMEIERMIQPLYKLRGYAVVSPDNRYIYFVAQSIQNITGGIAKLDLQSEEVVGFLPDISTSYITISGDGRYVYAAAGEHPSDFQKPPSLENVSFNLFNVIDAEDMETISSIEVGNGPRFIAISSDNSKAYVSNQWDNSVSVIDLSTMEITANITVGSEPREITITPDGKKAYVALPGVAQALAGEPGYVVSNKVAVVDLEQNILLSTVSAHFDPESVSMDPDGTRVYVGDGGCNGPTDYAEVHVIDTATDTYLRPIYIREPSTYAPAGIDVLPDNSKLFVIISNLTGHPERRPTSTLLVIDPLTGSITDRLGIDPQSVKVSADGSKLYVFSPAFDQSEAKLYVIDSDSMDITKSINLGGISTFAPIIAYRIILNSAETVAYINYNDFDVHYSPGGSGFPHWVDQNDTGLIAVDLINGSVQKIFYSETPAVNFHGITLTQDEKRLFVSDSASQTVVVINTSTNAIITRIPVGKSPAEIKLSADGRRIYVLQQFGSPMTVIDIDTYNVTWSSGFSFAHAQLAFELSPDERYFYAADFDSNFVLVYDIQEDKVVKVIDTGLDPLDTAITPDGRWLYVTEVTGDKIDMIDTTTNTIMKTVNPY